MLSLSDLKHLAADLELPREERSIWLLPVQRRSFAAWLSRAGVESMTDAPSTEFAVGIAVRELGRHVAPKRGDWLFSGDGLVELVGDPREFFAPLGLRAQAVRP